MINKNIKKLFLMIILEKISFIRLDQRPVNINQKYIIKLLSYMNKNDFFFH